jgi:radical SAM superfamily enzyme YgiQ (UPF0313 family)
MLERYKGPTVDLTKPTLRPRRDLLPHGYLWEGIQTSRGCPFNCSFCTVTKYLGKEYRKRMPNDVLDELDGVKGRWVGFVDDNLIGNTDEQREVSKELFAGMIEKKLNKRYWMQTSLNAANDEQALKLAAKAGCVFAVVGFEAIDEESLKAMRKGVNLRIGIKQFEEMLKQFHKYSIPVLGAFIAGNDYEPPEYYKHVARFCIKAGVDICNNTFLTPFPGTDLMAQLVREDRLVDKDFPKDWAKYDFSHMVHKPKGTTREAVYRGQNYINSKIYGFPVYHYRLLKSFLHLRGLDQMYTVYKINQLRREMYLKADYRKREVVTP